MVVGTHAKLRTCDTDMIICMQKSVCKCWLQRRDMPHLTHMCL